ncbi:MAG: hypothetical protein HOI31_05270 [Gammaproteobacteria bacterium]|jgi:23S rRNA A2030 N6-methylase RlmJ|nr:hypothetical protein [Thiotrichales bacterium]MBT5745685.1 hypothetical protein [Gammaproteobacteria bacterium]
MVQYDHRNKVGNQGDLIKHFALYSAASDMANTMAFLGKRRKVFSYVETHTGRSHYQIDMSAPSSDWLTGAGYYLDNYQRFLEQIDPKDELLLDRLNGFGELLESRQVGDEIKYLGSSALVSNQLTEAGIDYHADLFDVNQEVCQELECNSNQLTTVQCSSGYEGARNIKDIDLLFIDPPDLKPGIEGHFQRYKNLLFHCYREHIPYVSWNPLYADQSLAGPSLECRIVNETARIHGLGLITVRWSDWSEKMCGCQMLFNVVGGSLYVEQCNKLALMMGWKIEA